MKRRILTAAISTLLIITFTNVGAANNKITVTGQVSDMGNNMPISGVSVSLKGSSIGTKTNSSGYYKVQIEKGSYLVFRHKTYESKTQKVKSNKLNILLKRKTKKENLEKSKNQIGRYSTPATMEMAFCTEQNFATYDKKSAIHYTPKTIIPNINTEEYSSYDENRFKDPKNDPLSTFSLDVDAASYSNARRTINNGHLPSKNSIRIEEMLNYFSYDYKQPKGKDPIKINTEVHTCPWNKKHLLARIGIKAKEISTDKLPASNFVFLLDVSGSMSNANKLPLVKSSLKLLSNNLRPEDRVAIVVYAGAAGVVLESTPGDNKQKILEAMEKLQAGGSTAGGAGIQLAYKIAQKNFKKEGNNRIILCTDGDFNVGISSEKGLEELIEDKRKSGILLTVLGFGMGNYKDNKLQTLSQKGNGNHAYIDNIQEANKVLVNEFGSTMYAVAIDVKLQVEFNPSIVSSYRLVGYESRLLNKEDFNDDTKDAGELGAGHTVTALYEIIPAGTENRYGGIDDLRYQNEQVSDKKIEGNPKEEMMFIKLRYKPIGSNKSKKVEVAVSANINNRATDNFNFIASVAMFSQLLKDSDFKGNAKYDDVLALANKGIGVDKRGYRREFIRLVESVNQMVE